MQGIGASKIAGAIALVGMLLSAPSARAEDQLKVAIGQINNWENQMPTLGQDAGIFKKNGLTLDNFGTAGAGETMQPIIAGSADIGIGVGVAGVMRVFSKGAPVRILLPAFTGTGDLYWYVKADSPLKAVTDTTDRNTIAYSTSGSSSNNIVVAFKDNLGVKAKAVATGTPAATLTAVMSGQVDIGWGAFPMGLKEVEDGKVRIIARGSDIASLDKQTVRVVIVNADVLKNRKDAVLRFAKAYREAVDWMYADPDAIKRYAQKVMSPEDFVRRSIPKIYPKASLQTDEMKDMAGIQSDAVKLKFLDQPLSKEQLAELLQFRHGDVAVDTNCRNDLFAKLKLVKCVPAGQPRRDFLLGEHGVSLPRPAGERVGRGGYGDAVSHRRAPFALVLFLYFTGITGVECWTAPRVLRPEKLIT